MSKNDLLPDEDEDKKDENEERVKIFEGRFEYFKGENFYSEETFEVFTNDQVNTTNNHYFYNAQCLTRIETGELLKINVLYHTDHQWLPLQVFITKSMGTLQSEELFDFDDKEHRLTYSFKNSKQEKKIALKAPPRFQIATPCFLTSMLFTKTMRFSTQGTDEVHVITSYNNWSYEKAPKDEILLVEQPKQAREEITIKGNALSCTEYSISKEAKGKSKKAKPLTFYVSKHIGIPYHAEVGDGVIITTDKLKKIED